MAQENKLSTVSKRAEAERRIKVLNPYATRLGMLMEDYASDLDKLVKSPGFGHQIRRDGPHQRTQDSIHRHRRQDAQILRFGTG